MIETKCLYTVCWCQWKIESIYQKFSYTCLECTLARARHSGKHLVKGFYFGGYINISSRRCVTSTDGIFIIHQTRWFYFRKYREGHRHIHHSYRQTDTYVIMFFHISVEIEACGNVKTIKQRVLRCYILKLYVSLCTMSFQTYAKRSMWKNANLTRMNSAQEL